MPAFSAYDLEKSVEQAWREIEAEDINPNDLALVKEFMPNFGLRQRPLVLNLEFTNGAGTDKYTGIIGGNRKDKPVEFVGFPFELSGDFIEQLEVWNIVSALRRILGNYTNRAVKKILEMIERKNNANTIS